MLELLDVIPVGAFQCNCCVLATPEGKAVIVDPGDEHERIVERVKAHGLEVVHIVHTHAHLDHVMGTTQLHDSVGGPVSLHPDDAPLYQNLSMQAQMFGWRVDEARPVDGALEDGQRLAVGAGSLDVLHTPGHTPGSVCFHAAGSGLLLSGDTLFQGSIGRTDLWGGDMQQLLGSIRDKLMVLEPTTRVIPGHGPATTIEDEVRLNPFLQGLHGGD